MFTKCVIIFFSGLFSNNSLRRTSRAASSDDESRAASSDGDSANTARLEVDPPQLNERLPSMQDVETTTKRPDEAPLPVDFLLLTVKDCEFLACYRQLINPFRCWYDNIGYVYFENTGDRDKVKVALIRSNEGSSGPGGALTTIKNAVPVLRPKAVISVGTCSSLNPEKAKLGEVVVSAKLKELSTGMRSYVSRRFLYVIKHSADGFKAPLNNPQAHEPNVHCNGEFLSGPELVSAQSRRKELAESNPQAIAIEREGEGEFLASVPS